MGEDITVTSNKSVALQALDACLQFEGVINSRRSFGQNVSEDNINDVVRNVDFIVKDLQANPVFNTYKLWMWLLKMSYDSKIPVQAHLHLPILNYKKRLIPQILYQPYGWLKKKFGISFEVLEEYGYHTYLAFTSLDDKWLRIEEGPGRVGMVDEWGDLSIYFRDAIEAIKDNILDDIFPVSYLYDEVIPLQQSQVFKKEEKAIKALYTENCGLLALLYISRFFPYTVRYSMATNKLNRVLITNKAFEKRVMMPVLVRHTYELLKWGIPSIYRLFNLEYPSESFLPYLGTVEGD